MERGPADATILRAPGILDPGKHYARPGGSTGLSDMERKMRLMMEQATGPSEEDEGDDDDNNNSCTDRGVLPGTLQRSAHYDPAPPSLPSPLARLPIEIVERILAHVMQPSDDQVSDVASTNKAMRMGIASTHAARLCLVSRQFDALVRPMMYRRIHVSHRKTRALLRTLEGSNAKLATYIRELTLDSRIWTSDVNEDTIARIFVAVRRHIVRLRVGANESALLPYLFYGHPTQHTEEQKESHAHLEPTALQALHICWRDEVDFDSTYRRPRTRPQQPGHVDGNAQDEEAESSTDAGTDDDAVRDTLRGLFEHDAVSSRRDLPSLGAASALANLEHLTLDLYTHAQLAQLFLSSGYFVQSVLPRLRLLRVELPLAVLQFAAPIRGALAKQWPCKRWRLHSRNIEDMLNDRIEQNRSVTIDYAVLQQQQQQRRGSSDNANGNGMEAFEGSTERQLSGREASLHSDGSASDGSEGNIVLAPCADYQLKALLQRYVLNVHKNDMTLFEVLLAPTRALEQGSWSSRAAIAAYCLKATLEKRLRESVSILITAAAADRAASSGEPVAFDPASASAKGPLTDFVVFPLASFQANGVPHFWRTQWDEADTIYEKYLPATGGALGRSNEDTDPMQNARKTAATTAALPHVAILLKWPTAQEAFFHHSAMV